MKLLQFGKVQLYVLMRSTECSSQSIWVAEVPSTERVDEFPPPYYFFYAVPGAVALLRNTSALLSNIYFRFCVFMNTYVTHDGLPLMQKLESHLLIRSRPARVSLVQA